MKKQVLALSLAWILVIGTLVPIQAQEPVMQISSWAVMELNEAEKYGLYPMEWYYEDFLDPIAAEDFDTLYANMVAKLESRGLESEADFEAVVASEIITREAVLTELYYLMEAYGVPVSEDMIETMVTFGILKGDGVDYHLDALCNMEQAVILAMRTIYQIYQSIEVGTQGFFWTVENNQITVHILGSIHIGATDLYPFSEHVLEAFYAADALILEADLFSETDMEAFYAEALLPEGQTLKDVLSASTYEKAEAILGALEVPIDAYAAYRPWVLANELNVLLLSEEDGSVDASLGIDMYFGVNALLNEIPIYELEGLVVQAQMFNALSEAALDTYLLSAVEAVEAAYLDTTDESSNTSKDMLKDWFDYYQAGDVASFEVAYMAEMDATDADFTQMLLGVRDANMAATIINLLEWEGEATYFIVVGAAHLIGDHAILRYLEDEGYNILYHD